LAISYKTTALKQEIDNHETRIITLEKSDVVQDDRIKTLQSDTREMENQVDLLEKAVIKFGELAIAIKWLLGALGVSVIGLIWSLITGQASIAFK